MPEGGKHAPVLIAASWQALKRAESNDPQTELCNCTIVILFAGFYLEANLNHIIERLHAEQQMRKFLGKRYPGLQHKLAWFYNEFVARKKARSRKQLFTDKGRVIRRKICSRFPGFAKLHTFRNDLSHGVINSSARSLEETQLLRSRAKEIASELFSIMQKHGHDIPRDINYYDAIAD